MALQRPIQLYNFLNNNRAYVDNTISGLDYNNFCRLHNGYCADEYSNGIILDGEIYKLGWNSILRAKIDCDKILIKDVSNVKYGCTKTLNIRVDEIVTRAVSSCTLLIIRCGSELLFAHIDKSDHIKAMESLMDIFDISQKQCTAIEMFISRINNDEQKKFCEIVKSRAEAAFCSEFIRDLRVINQAIERLKYKNSEVVMHNELGIYIDPDGSPQIFGDLCYLILGENLMEGQYVDVPFLFAENLMNAMTDLYDRVRRIRR